MHLFLLDQLSWQTFTQAFCWMLVHSLWQGFLVTVICGLVIMLTKNYNSLLRYNILVSLFFLFLVGCATTFLLEYRGMPQTNHNNVPGLINRSIPASILPGIALQRLLVMFSNYCSANASMLVVIWFIIFIFKTGRIIRSVQYEQLLRKHKCHTANDYWQNRIRYFCSRLQIKRRVILVESALIKIPVVMGFLKPIILVPVGLMTQLPGSQVKAILLHELAHIRRNDYLVNLLQNIADSIFFFNPALLWLSALMREERENCCDDIALHFTKDKKQFLEALISFKEHAFHASAYATAFRGKKGALVHRFTRIVTNQNRSLDFSGRLFLLVSLVAGCVLFVAVASRQHNIISGNIRPLNRQDTFVVPLEIVKHPLHAAMYENLSLSSKKSATADKKRQRSYSTSTKITVASKTAKKVESEIETNNRLFTGDAQHEIASVTLNEIEKMERDEEQVMVAKKQAEMDAIQAMKYRQQVEKENVMVSKKAWEMAIAKEKSRKDEQEALMDMQEALLQKQRAEADAMKNKAVEHR